MNNITERISIQNLYELVLNKKKVSPYALIEESEKIYRFVRAVGIENVKVYYKTDTEQETVLIGHQIPEEIRAVSILVVEMLNVFEYNQCITIEKLYDLSTSVNLIMDGIIGFLPANAFSLDRMSVQDLIDKIAM